MSCERCKELEATLRNAIIELEDWGGFIDPHTKSVWGFDEMIAEFKCITKGNSAWSFDETVAKFKCIAEGEKGD
jgi:hypothetical protein